MAQTILERKELAELIEGEGYEIKEDDDGDYYIVFAPLDYIRSLENRGYIKKDDWGILNPDVFTISTK
jgi:hypothetical protein